MDILRVVVALVLTVLVFKHAAFWGRSFMALKGMKSPVETPAAYLNPGTRFLAFGLVQSVLWAAVWLVWPYGHWGLLAILIWAWGFRSGVRRELLRNFVRQLLSRLEMGEPLDEAWLSAEHTIRSISGHSTGARMHASDPTGLVRYVVNTACKRDEALEIDRRWREWLNSQAAQGQ